MDKRIQTYTLFKAIFTSFFGFYAFLNKTLHEFQVAYLHTILFFVCVLF